MTSLVTAPTSGPKVPPPSARRVKPASSGADRVFGLPLRGGGLLVLLIMTTIGSQFVFAPAASAQDAFVPISGAGSTWSFNALDQWRRNIASLLGIPVNFAPVGSSDGRNQFKNGTVDFAVSETEYGLNDGGIVDLPPDRRTFGYLPTVAGGTAFMYNLKIDGKRVTNLRLSGEVLAKIFTLRITSWADPAIKADNPGLALPDSGIVPVVRSDGSGTTAHVTRWLAARHAGIWDAYCDTVGRTVKPCGVTSFYPLAPMIEAKSGSQGVAGFVAQDSSNEKGRSLSEFAYYFLCGGQQQAEVLGYAPLPINLVQAGVDQVAQIPGTTNKLNRNDLRQCNNPTFSPDGTNLLATNAPQPPECDRKGPAQCTSGTGGAPAPTPPNGPQPMPPSGPPAPSPGGPPMPPRGPPTSSPGRTSCLAAIQPLIAGLPRAVAETSPNGHRQWVSRIHLAEEIVARTTHAYQRHLRGRFVCDVLFERVVETARPAPVQVIRR